MEENEQQRRIDEYNKENEEIVRMNIYERYKNALIADEMCENERIEQVMKHQKRGSAHFI
jgi:hypothetical protein